MKLSELLIYDEIVIQCHDNPDPDAIASGYALYSYFKSKNKEVRLIYSGRRTITKPNIVLMVESLNIPIEHVQELNVEGLLITVDCQYGAGNVTRFNAENVAIIDHHIQEVAAIKRQEVRSDLVSASTIVWDMLCQEGFDVNDYPDVSTALYYGLFTDSSAFTEIHQALDKDMRDSLQYDVQLIRRLKNSIITLRELEIAGMALIRNSYNAANNYVMVKAQECDPNILGVISDFALQVDCVNVAIVYTEMQEGIKYSVRSCVKEVMANELAIYLSEGIGNGGGHIDRAAGFISRNKYNEIYSHLNADEYFLRRLTEYYQSFEVIDGIDISQFEDSLKCYKKLPSSIGYVELSQLVSKNTPIIIRSPKEDIETVVEEDIFLIIDGDGMIYLIDLEEFQSTYEANDKEFDIPLDYFPRIRIKKDGRYIYLKNHMKQCLVKGEAKIWAKPLTKSVKIFTKAQPDYYKVGQAGDYLVMGKEGTDEVYIIRKEVFDTNYLPI